MPKATSYDFTSLTMREIGQIERLSGQGLGALADDKAPKAMALAAIAYTFKLRENPSYTWNEAQSLTLKEISAINSALEGLSITDGTEDDATTEAAPDDAA